MNFFWWLVIIVAGVAVLYMTIGRTPARVGGPRNRPGDDGPGPGADGRGPGGAPFGAGTVGDLPSPDTQFMRHEHGEKTADGPGGPDHAKVGEAREPFPDRTGATTALALGAERPPADQRRDRAADHPGAETELGPRTQPSPRSGAPGVNQADEPGRTAAPPPVHRAESPTAGGDPPPEAGLGQTGRTGGGPADGFDSPTATVGASGAADRPAFGGAFGRHGDVADAPGAGDGQFAAGPLGFDAGTAVAPRQAAGADDPPRFPGAIGQDREPVTYGSPPAQAPGMREEGAHFTAVPPDTGHPAGADDFPNRAPAGAVTGAPTDAATGAKTGAEAGTPEYSGPARVDNAADPHDLTALVYEQAGPAALPEEMRDRDPRLLDAAAGGIPTETEGRE